MASNNRPVVHSHSIPRFPVQQYFLITMTNYPNLLLRTQQYQQSPHQQWLQLYQNGFILTNLSTLNTVTESDEHEKFLYEALQVELQHAVRAYLQRTRRLFPINLVFDLSAVNPRL